MSQEAGQAPDIERGNDTGDRQLPVAPNGQPQALLGNSRIHSLFADKVNISYGGITEDTQPDIDAMLIFTGLFSAALAALLAVSVQDLRPNTQDTSAFYLENIFQLLADPNLPRASIPSKPPPFSPPSYAVWVNSLWFLSLVLSLTGGLLATLLRQWGRQYNSLVRDPAFSPKKQARLLYFFVNGLGKFHVSWAIRALPALLHISLFVFFAGLLIFLFNINHTVFISAIWWIVLSSTIYAFFTLFRIFQLDSPYSTPLTPAFWYLCAGVSYVIVKVLSTFHRIFSDQTHLAELSKHYRERFFQGWLGTIHETVSDRARNTDFAIVILVLKHIYEDDTRETFFGGIPDLFVPNWVEFLDQNYPSFLGVFRQDFGDALKRFFLRTLLSNSIIESDKIRRLTICTNAMDAVYDLRGISGILLGIVQDLKHVPLSVEMGQTLARCRTSDDRHTIGPLRYIAAHILASVRERDDRWVALACDTFDLPEQVIRENVAHGDDSVLLFILIHVTRRALHSRSWILGILLTLSQFDIRNTHPEQQHDFCTLWNEVVFEARDEAEGANSPPSNIFREIRHLFTALHRGTDAAPTRFPAPIGDNDDDILLWPWSYRSCNIAGHRPVSAAHSPVPPPPAGPGTPSPPASTTQLDVA